jgi:hypothetical protein
MILLIFLAIIEIALSGFFIYSFVKGITNEYLLGGLMTAQLLVISLIILTYYKTFISFNEVSEDREEEYLW